MPSRKMPSRLSMPVVVSLALVAGCEQAAQGDELFPLSSGRHWTYRATTDYQGQSPYTHEMTIRALGSDTINNQTAWRRYSDTGTEYWIRSDESGIYRVASKHALDTKVTVEKKQRFVLKKPVAVDTAWTASTTSYLLERHNQLPKRISAKYPSFPMNYRITATDAVVSTPAGEFTQCVQVEGKAAIRLYVDTAFSWRDIPLTTQEWYCPTVGLVRLERSEPSPSRFLKGGTFTMELLDWE
ncbi:MAG: hypothetical protein ACRBC3_14410 [Burkholderiaceae bacterium]